MEIIYEDDILLVVNKPAGVPTLKNEDATKPSLALMVELTHPALMSIPECGIAHRLDNDTSGVVCIGKTKAAYESLRGQFSQGSATKEYCALVVGALSDEGTIEVPIAHHPRKSTKMIVCESPARAKTLKARTAHTVYRAIDRHHCTKETTTTPYTLLEVTIATGVRHQIRAHLAWLGFPLAGDRLYQNPKKRAMDVLPLTRHFLHASRIDIAHPATGKPLSLESPLPKDLQQVLECMDRQGLP